MSKMNIQAIKKATMRELLDERDRCLVLLGAIDMELRIRGVERRAK